MGKYGLKIRNIKAGTLYEMNLGVREYFSYTRAMFTNNLLQDFLVDNGLKVVKDDYTRDIICIDFDFGTRSYEESRKHIEKIIAIEKNKRSEAMTEEDEEKKDRRLEELNLILEKVDKNKDKYIKVSKEDIRAEFYKNGVDVEYITKDKEGNIKQREKIHYKMLYRSTGKAKNGSCMFINEKLHKKAYKFISMGIPLPKKNAPIVEMSAYNSVVTSTIIDKIKINPKNILILKDVDSFFRTNVVSVETNEHKHCVANYIEDYELKNTLFDGQAIIDESIFPEWGDGYLLLRHHMCKMATFKGRIQLFFKDYFGDNYENATVEDMWGNQHYAKDIEIITTDNAMKWIKFDVGYDYWCEKVFENDCMFGIVKTAHKSKLGDVQKMSYQMINALDLDIMDDVIKQSKDYIESMKKDNEVFLQYLQNNSNFSNDYKVLIALCEQNMEFTRSEYFRVRKKEIIRGYIKSFRTGKVLQDADNLVIIGSPYAMLLHSVGEDVNKDDTFKVEDGLIQCFAQRFKDGEHMACFRSPFNSKNNMGYLRNVYSDKLLKYFDLGEQIIAINLIGTDFQDRSNGSDQDSDTVYCTSQPSIVKHAKHCYEKYPTIVNNIPKDKNIYSNNIENYALIDNNLANSQLAIGESSNLAQLALTYSYNFEDQKYKDYVCILSVLAQVSIDSAKRKFDIDLSQEIKRIKKDLKIGQNGYPLFWKHIQKKTKGGQTPRKFNINRKLKCPMNYLCEIKLRDFRSNETTLPMDHFFVKYDLKENRRKSKKVEELIEKYSLSLYNGCVDEDEDTGVLMDDFDKMIEDISKIYISKDYLGLFSWLIDRAFLITNYQKAKNNNDIWNKTRATTNENKAILLKILYDINDKNLLKVWSKNT